jgi:hypothetical protein
MGFDCLRVYGISEDSKSNTSAKERDHHRVLHGGDLDWIGTSGYIKSSGDGGRVSNLIKIFNKQSAIYDPGADLMVAPTQSTALVGGGGDYGGTAEDPTHPKPPVDASLALERAEGRLAIMAAMEDLGSNWDGQASGTRNAGPDERIFGRANLEDEFCMEEEDEEEVAPPVPSSWRMLARYYTLKAANYTVIHKHFSEVWRIRGKMTFKPLKDNFFIITFTSEGDYNFVDGGGPWIHLGVACLVAPFKESAQPSETILETVRLWVRFYDVPWKKQTKEYGELLGSKLGKVIKVDVDADGLKLSEYLRVRIDWPLNQRLLARFKTTIKGQPKPRIYEMRYERVPHFCFHCGLIGHNEEQCEIRAMGTQSLQYGATLRCSPKRKFQSRAISTPDEPPIKKSLRFNTPEGSVNSSSLGIPKSAGNGARTTPAAIPAEIPPAVDAQDGFEEREQRTEDAVENALVNTVSNMRLQINQEQGSLGQAVDATGKDGLSSLVQGSGSTLAGAVLAPNAMHVLQQTHGLANGSHGTPSRPNSSDMIPPLRGLSHLEISQGTDSDVSMTMADSLLGKRTAVEDEAIGQKLDLSLALHYSAPAGGKPKKGRKMATADEQGVKEDMKADSVAARTRRKIATGHRAPGNLTRPTEGSRQEK